jgi:hypothetical protein
MTTFQDLLMKYGIRFAFVLFLVVSVQAAPPSERALQEMMNIMQLETLLNQALNQMHEGITKQMEQRLQKSLAGKDLTPAQKAAMERFRANFAATMKEELSIAKVKEIYMQAYRETFTQEEVDGIIAFYKTPAGKAITEKNPIAMQKANEITQARIPPMTKKLETMQVEFEKELSKTK